MWQSSTGNCCNIEKDTSHMNIEFKLMLQANEKEQICTTSTSYICCLS